MSNCCEKLSNTATAKSKAPSVIYEGSRSEKTKLIGDCDITLADTTQDTYEILDDIYSEIDNSELGNDYITYTDLKTNTVLYKHEEELGNLNDKVTTLQNQNICELDITNCGINLTGISDQCENPITTLGELLKYLVEQNQV